MAHKRGKFITLEGGEGSGKTTNIPFIKDYLQSLNIPLVVTREPGGTQLAEKIRGLLLSKSDEVLTETTEILLMFAARAQHLNNVINPALAQGQWVLCDRFTDATYAYQGGGRGLPLNVIQWLENFVQGDLRPDLTVLLDIPVEISMARAKNRGVELDRFESEHSPFFSRIRQMYLQQAQQYPNRIKVIKADQSLPDVQQAIVVALANLLP